MGSPELYEYCINLFVHMFSIVKYQNKLIELSIFTGVNCIPIDDSFSGLNNVRYDSLYDKSYSEHFGFTETDIDLLVDKANALYHKNLNKTKLKEKISLCDNGYNIYDKMIYNPFSVMNCLYSLIQGTENPFKNYWANFDYPSLFLNSLETVPTKRYIDTLFKEDMVEFYSESDTNIRGISSNENIFLTIMQDSGYLKRIPETFKFNIQNNEIKFELYRIWLKRHSDDLFKVFIKPEEFENPEKFLKVFQENALPFFKADENPEYFFQSLLYLNLNKKGLNVILEKKTDDHKRIEIEITPDESLDKINEIVYIIEIKNQGSKSEGSGINDGLLEIFRKNYAVNELIEEKSFKIFVLRVVSFGYNEHSGWKISMAELRFTRENLHRVIKSFFLNNKERKNLFEELRYYSFSSFIG